MLLGFPNLNIWPFWNRSITLNTFTSNWGWTVLYYNRMTSILTFRRMSGMFAVLSWPVYHQTAKYLENLKQPSLCDVPGHTSQKHTGRIGRVLVTSQRKLSTPGAHHFWTYTKKKKGALAQKTVVKIKHKYSTTRNTLQIIASVYNQYTKTKINIHKIEKTTKPNTRTLFLAILLAILWWQKEHTPCKTTTAIWMPSTNSSLLSAQSHNIMVYTSHLKNNVHTHKPCNFLCCATGKTSCHESWAALQYHFLTTTITGSSIPHKFLLQCNNLNKQYQDDQHNTNFTRKTTLLGVTQLRYNSGHKSFFGFHLLL